MKIAVVHDMLMPIVHDGWVLVKVKAAGINPTDWKHVRYGGVDIGCRVGCDYAGVVEDGSKVSNFTKGFHGKVVVNLSSGQAFSNRRL